MPPPPPTGSEDPKVWEEDLQKMHDGLTEKLDLMIERADKNNDGLIDYDEFQTVINDRIQYLADQDREGGYPPYFKKLVEKYKANVAKIFKKIDKNKDGVLNKKELSKWMKQELETDLLSLIAMG